MIFLLRSEFLGRPKAQRSDVQYGSSPLSSSSQILNSKRAKLDPQNDMKSVQMECPICFKCIVSQKLAGTPCGHIFCFECIKEAITGRAVCPSCNKAVQLNALRELYLPV